MFRNLTQTLLVFAAISVALMPLAASDRIIIPAHVKDRHHPTLREWLNNNPRFRPALDADCCDSKESLGYDTAEHRENAENTPFYYAYGDLNRDGIEDFAIVLIDTMGHARSRKMLPRIGQQPWQCLTDRSPSRSHQPSLRSTSATLPVRSYGTGEGKICV
jgi:hypothetical protein